MGDREGSADAHEAPALRPGPVYLTVLAIASCGLVYELVAGALASYLLGDSVTQFSLVIGVYLTSLGLGAFLSRFVVRGVARRFVETEIGVALLGGLSAPMLFFAFTHRRRSSDCGQAMVADHRRRCSGQFSPVVRRS